MKEFCISSATFDRKPIGGPTYIIITCNIFNDESVTLGSIRLSYFCSYLTDIDWLLAGRSSLKTLNHLKFFVILWFMFYRKAFKATFLLVPLFGIHQFCLIYRPNSKTTPGYDVYEIASAIILNSQVSDHLYKFKLLLILTQFSDWQL